MTLATLLDELFPVDEPTPEPPTPEPINRTCPGDHTMMKTKLLQVDAETAAQWLAQNGVNRPLRPRYVKMARDMLEGRWLVNPQPIQFTAGGRLIDGQHRLHALVLAGVTDPNITVPLSVATGVPESAFDVIDQGDTRTSGQTLGIHGVTNSVHVAAAARTILRYERWPDRIWAGAIDVSKAEVVAFVLKCQDQVALLDPVRDLKRVNLNVSGWMSLQWLVIRHSERAELWPSFSAGVITGAGLMAGDPRLTLRNRGPAASAGEGWGGGQGRLGVYLKAWNAYAQDRHVRALRFRREELPMPVVK